VYLSSIEGNIDGFDAVKFATLAAESLYNRFENAHCRKTPSRTNFQPSAAHRHLFSIVQSGRYLVFNPKPAVEASG